MLSKTLQVEGYLREGILHGTFPLGKKIPSRSQLCRRFNCSRTVIERAVDILIRDGLLAGQKGSGTYVRNARQTDGQIRKLKLIPYFRSQPDQFSDLSSLNFDDLQISVEWIPARRSQMELESLCLPGTAVITDRPQIFQLPLLEKLRQRNIPVLLLNRDYDGFDHIITDPRSSIREGISWLLIEAGRDIAFVSRRPTVSRPYIAERVLSFYESAIELGARLRSDWCLSKKFEEFTGDVAEIGRSLFGSPQIPKGIFILNQEIVLPVVNCGQGYGLTPGKDYKLLTFDYIPALAGYSGIAMMKQPELLYEKEIRRWLKNVNEKRAFQSALKTDLKIQ